MNAITNYLRSLTRPLLVGLVLLFGMLVILSCSPAQTGGGRGPIAEGGDTEEEFTGGEESSATTGAALVAVTYEGATNRTSITALDRVLSGGIWRVTYETQTLVYEYDKKGETLADKTFIDWEYASAVKDGEQQVLPGTKCRLTLLSQVCKLTADEGTQIITAFNVSNSGQTRKVDNLISTPLEVRPFWELNEGNPKSWLVDVDPNLETLYQPGVSGAVSAAGYRRKVWVPDTPKGCLGLEAGDHLNLFQWVCKRDPAGKGVFFYSTGLQQGRGLANAITDSGLKFRQNYFNVSGPGFVRLSLPEQWWDDTITPLPDGDTPTLDANKIYTVVGTRELSKITIPAGPTALVVLPNSSIKYNGNPVLCGNPEGGPVSCLVDVGQYSANPVSTTDNSILIEGSLDGKAADNSKVNTVVLATSRPEILRVHNAVVRNGSANGLFLAYGSLTEITSSHFSGNDTGLKILGGGVKLRDVTAMQNTTGLDLSDPANAFPEVIISRSRFVNNSSHGIASTYVSIVMVQSVVAFNGGKGFYSHENGHLLIDKSVIVSNEGGGLSTYILGNTFFGNGTFVQNLVANNGPGTWAVGFGYDGGGFAAIYYQGNSVNLYDMAVVHHDLGTELYAANSNWTQAGVAKGKLYYSANCSLNVTNITMSGSDCTDADPDLTISTGLNLRNSGNRPFIEPTTQPKAGDEVDHWELNAEPHVFWGRTSGNNDPIDASAQGYNAGDTSMTRWNFSQRAANNQLRAFDCLTEADSFNSSLHSITHDGDNTYTSLRGAMEIYGDNVGNDNDLCEAGELCVSAQYIGAYQGHNGSDDHFTMGFSGGFRDPIAEVIGDMSDPDGFGGDDDGDCEADEECYVFTKNNFGTFIHTGDPILRTSVCRDLHYDSDGFGPVNMLDFYSHGY